ncbi:MAG: prephenate dehydrogenase [Lachnospiraceae bacterium]|nr:prephenate dehydrogenase [Lachnospiraceae bacterium]
MSTTIGFIGLGLIGGSIAKAFKKNITDCHITAFDISPEALELAVSQQIVDVATSQIDESFRICDYIFLCAPVQKNDTNLHKIKEFMKNDCIITDVGSVKNNIHQHILAADLEEHFIGGHPMAGSERYGFANSKASLLENAYYILTPTPKTPSHKLAAFRELILQTGAIPLILDYKQHDYVTAAISHLPHVIAASLVNLVHDSDSDEGIMKMVAAGGFKDITRIASSSAQMWQQICLTNTDNISLLLGKYIDSLINIQNQLKMRNGNSLYQLFDDAREYRDSFINTSSGPIKRSYVLTVDIADQAGSLAAITTILAVNGINIKNIGITHNREQEYGALRLEFYDEAAIEKAKELLTQRSYLIYEKKL